MRAIFLDIDGVMNSHRSVHEEYYRRKAGDKPRAASTSHWLPPYHIEPLNRIISETDAKVVISSTWRMGNSAKDMQRILDHFGFIGEVRDITPIGRMCMDGFVKHYGGVPRGSEICEWLAYHPEVTSFVILDDDNDMQIYGPRLVLTDAKVGLTEEDASNAISLFNDPEKQTPHPAIDK